MRITDFVSYIDSVNKKLGGTSVVAFDISVSGNNRHLEVPPIVQVIYNPPCTIVRWGDDTKTIVKCGEGEKWDEEVGLAMAIVKKMFGSRSAFQSIVDRAYRQPPKEDK